MEDANDESKRLLLPAELESVEATIAPLPVIYKAFLKMYGGHIVSSKLAFPYVTYIEPSSSLRSDLNWMKRREQGTTDIQRLYGEANATLTGLLGWYEYFSERIPATLIPIGNNTTGDQVCLGVRSNEQGKVFLWVRDEEIEWDDFIEDEKVPRDVQFWNIYLIDNSVDNFVQKMSIRQM